jgi:hypothetical protein
MMMLICWTRKYHKEGQRSELDADKRAGLEVNAEKANYMFLFRH